MGVCQSFQDVALDLTIEAGGFAAFYQTNGEPDENFLQFLDEMSILTSVPLSEYNMEWKPLQQEMEEFRPVFDGTFQPNENTIIVEPGEFLFNCTGTQIE